MSPPRNPTRTKGIIALLREIGTEGVKVHKDSGGKLVVECTVEITGKYLTDKNGELVAMVEVGAGGPVTEVVLDAKAKTSSRWTRKKKLDWDGTLKMTWVLRPNQRKIVETKMPFTGLEKTTTEDPA